MPFHCLHDVGVSEDPFDVVLKRGADKHQVVLRVRERVHVADVGGPWNLHSAHPLALQAGTDTPIRLRHVHPPNCQVVLRSVDEQVVVAVDVLVAESVAYVSAGHDVYAKDG